MKNMNHQHTIITETIRTLELEKHEMKSQLEELLLLKKEMAQLKKLILQESN